MAAKLLWEAGEKEVKPGVLSTFPRSLVIKDRKRGEGDKRLKECFWRMREAQAEGTNRTDGSYKTSWS